MAVVKGFKIGTTAFRVGRQTLTQGSWVKIEGYNCETKRYAVYADPKMQLQVRIDFGARAQSVAMLRSISTPASPANPDNFSAAMARLFGGLAPRPVRAEAVGEEFKRCYKYVIEMQVHSIAFELKADIHTGNPRITKTAIGVIKTPMGYTYRLTGAARCCDDVEDISQRSVFHEEWLNDRTLLNARKRKPLIDILKESHRQAMPFGVPPLSGLTAGQGPQETGWTLDPNAPAISLGRS